MGTILCIVDMQPEFSAHVDCIDGVLHQIRLAKRRRDPIIVLEYRDVAPTCSDIAKVLQNTPNVKYVSKGQNDGSFAFLLAARRFEYEKVRVCGVNKCFCVRDTAAGIRKKNIPVEIATDAVACVCCKP